MECHFAIAERYTGGWRFDIYASDDNEAYCESQTDPEYDGLLCEVAGNGLIDELSHRLIVDRDVVCACPTWMFDARDDTSSDELDE